MFAWELYLRIAFMQAFGSLLNQLCLFPLSEISVPCITGGESGSKVAKMVEGWWVHFFQRILLPPVWRFKEKI